MSYEKNLKLAIAKWSNNPIEDEWSFEKFRQDAIDSMSSSEAFIAMDTTIEHLVVEKDESNAIEIMQTITNLASHSDTTEVPSKLLENKDIISKQFEGYGDYASVKLKGLFNFYHL